MSDQAMMVPRRGVLGMAVAAGVAPTGLLAAAPAAPSFLPLLGALAAIVLPAGKTVSAGASADLKFILTAINAGLAGARPDTLATLATTLESIGKAPFLKLAPAQRLSTLRALDSAVFGAEQRRGTGWDATKALILMSYYSSEAGASQELAYEPVPGRFDPDLHVDAQTPALSNDWTGAGLRLGSRS